MRIDSAFIRREREKRGWSQEQLAAAAGLGVRTIQRLEASGIASAESAKCLAAVFEVPYTRLMMAVPVMSPVASPARRVPMRHWAAAATVTLGIVSSLLLVPRASADEIAIALVLATDTGESRMNIQVESGQAAEVKLDRSLRLVLTPTIHGDDGVLVKAELYGWDGHDYQLAGKPRLLMRKGVETRLQMNLGNGRTVRMGVTPKAG